MEKSKKELEALVISQKEQLGRYETRLKDVVTAYKGLLKEKEALESSLSALSSLKDKTSKNVQGEEKNSADVLDTEGSSNLQLQIATLMNSLATLSAEKSRMEASFQADKKQLRNDIVQKDKTIAELQEKVKDLTKQNAVDVENMKSKIIIERHERDKESNNHMVMIRELQKLYADERHLKENLEMQLNDLKTQFSEDNSNTKVKELMTELKEAKEKLKEYESKKINFSQENSSILLQLQNEMHNLKQQHAIAIKTEQKRALVAEERNKKLAALHEDRVANLEARLAELSHTVGTYDRLRQQDQENIQKLKEKIAQLANAENDVEQKEEDVKEVSAIIDEIMRLKKMLLIENSRSSHPVDINKIFNTRADHSQCIDDLTKIQIELDVVRTENLDLKQAVTIQKNHIKTLQEKVKVLNRNIEEQEIELKTQTDRLNQAVKIEKSKWKDVINAMENEYRGKLGDLEQQLQKQRSRSLHLLDEKENEIKALKTSFEIFTPQNLAERSNDDTRGNRNEKNTGIAPSISNTVVPSMVENCHMLHYASELARRDVEISSLRKAKHSAETALRQALQDKVSAQEELNDKILRLEEHVDRLERCKTREGANLEYLKNVIFSFLSTKDAQGKKHMVNAIGAVLQFTPAEIKAINNLFHRK